MNINNSSVLDMVNIIIAKQRLNKNEILHVVKLARLSNDIKELEDNLKWESVKSKININN